MKKRTLRDHVKWIKERFQNRLGFYNDRGLTVSPTAHVLLYQNRRYMIAVLTNAIRAIREPGDESPLMNKWRATSSKNFEIAADIQKILIDQRSASLAQLTYASEKHGSRESVRRVVAHGIELGLLQKDDDQFSLSEKFVSELFDRSIMRIRHRDVIKLGMLTSSINVVENIIQNADEMNKDPSHPLASFRTLIESIAVGDYDDEIN